MESKTKIIRFKNPKDDLKGFHHLVLSAKNGTFVCRENVYLVNSEEEESLRQLGLDFEILEVKKNEPSFS